MINGIVTGVVGALNGTMVSYIISFFITIGLLTLMVRGAVLSWDILKTSYLALRTDIRQAKREGTSIFRVWKDRVNSLRGDGDRI